MLAEFLSKSKSPALSLGITLSSEISQNIELLKKAFNVKWATVKIEDPESDDDEDSENPTEETYQFIKDYFFICDRLERFILLYMLIKLRFITG